MTNAPETPVLEAESTGTPLDGLRKEFAKKVAPARLLKKFPGAGGRLVGEFHIAPKADVRAAAETQNDEYLLSQCLVQVLIEDAESPSANADGLLPLGEWAGQPGLDPLRIDARLAELLGIPWTTPAALALRLYDNNDLVLAQHVGEIAEWSLDVTNKAYSDFPLAA